MRGTSGDGSFDLPEPGAGGFPSPAPVMLSGDRPLVERQQLPEPRSFPFILIYLFI